MHETDQLYYLQMMLRVTKVSFPHLEFKILHVLHNLSKRKQKGTPVVQANSKSKVMSHSITSLPVMFSLSTLHFKLSKLNDPVHLFWRLYCQASQHSKRRTLHSDHMHAAVHGSHVNNISMAANLQRNRNPRQKCIVTGQHYNAWNSDVSLPRTPLGSGGGEV